MNALARAPIFLFALAGAALAQEPPTTGGALIGRFWDAAGLRAPPPPTADFVRESRPAQSDYVPLAPPPEKAKKRTAAEMQALGASLDAAIAANRAKAARVKIPDSAPKPRAR